MKRILRIDASMRKQNSYGRQLLDRLVNQMAKPGYALSHRDLAEGIPMINESWIVANVTDPASRTAEQRSILSLSDVLVDELREACTILIAIPIYNFHVPAAFKAWIDLVTRSAETFRYTESGPVGLLENKRAIVVVTSGGTKLGSELDFVTSYLKHILGFIGIQELLIVDGSGVGRNPEGVFNNAVEQIQRIFDR
ncbi:MAG: NAD(P)H-dependent oxidoreductase [Spongiibacteraceae bacterium]|nr:NAD(P)H-dependent oxidoreductase [Spongiibacteraceae bacterium]